MDDLQHQNEAADGQSHLTVVLEVMEPLTRIIIGPRRMVFQTEEVRAQEVGLGEAIAVFCQRPDVVAVSLPDGSVEIVPSPTPQVSGEEVYHFGFPIRFQKGYMPALVESHRSLITPNVRIKGRALARPA